jgi:ABC-type transport system involved in multi-copper enzyme maturation permease subunit
MVLAIVSKELRETRAFAALAVGVYLIYLSKLTGKLSPLVTRLFGWVPWMNAEAPDVPFVQDNFVAILTTIGVALAITLGFRQSAWEPSQGTALYLLHLPPGRQAIFLTKILTGIGILLGCTLFPVLTYATWAAIPGTHPSPFEWSMTGLAFRTWLVMPLLYLGAFASGIRPGRWIGSRLLPLVAAALFVVPVISVPHWWLIAFPLLLLVAAVLVSDILWAAETRDF